MLTKHCTIHNRVHWSLVRRNSQGSLGFINVKPDVVLFKRNYASHTLPKNLTFDEVKYLEELKQSHELNQPPGNPYSSDLPNALNNEQFDYHTCYSPCCQFLLKHMVDLSDQMNWLEYLITRPLLPLPTSSNPQPKSHSAPLSPSTTN